MKKLISSVLALLALCALPLLPQGVAEINGIAVGGAGTSSYQALYGLYTPQATSCPGGTWTALSGASYTLSQEVQAGDRLVVHMIAKHTGTAGGNAAVGIQLGGKDTANQPASGVLRVMGASTGTLDYKATIHILTVHASAGVFRATTEATWGAGQTARYWEQTGVTLPSTPTIEIFAKDCTSGDTVNLESLSVDHIRPANL